MPEAAKDNEYRCSLLSPLRTEHKAIVGASLTCIASVDVWGRVNWPRRTHVRAKEGRSEVRYGVHSQPGGRWLSLRNSCLSKEDRQWACQSRSWYSVPFPYQDSLAR